MSLLGHSRAQLVFGPSRVTKRGPGMSAQGVYCGLLGPAVCPRVLQFLDDGYVMERLHVATPITAEQMELWLQQVLHLLATAVWRLPPAIHRPKALWHAALVEWAIPYPWLELQQMMAYLYPELEPVEVLTHGDPTLANVLWVPGVAPHYEPQLRIGDPLVPRPYIPSVSAVDRGKVLQSVMGWEHHLDSTWPTFPDPDPVAERLLTGLSPMEQARSYFWGAVHCARLIPYARRPATTDWAISTGECLLMHASQLL